MSAFLSRLTARSQPTKQGHIPQSISPSFSVESTEQDAVLTPALNSATPPLASGSQPITMNVSSESEHSIASEHILPSRPKSGRQGDGTQLQPVPADLKAIEARCLVLEQQLQHSEAEIANQRECLRERDMQITSLTSQLEVAKSDIEALRKQVVHVAELERQIAAAAAREQTALQQAAASDEALQQTKAAAVGVAADMAFLQNTLASLTTDRDRAVTRGLFPLAEMHTLVLSLAASVRQKKFKGSTELLTLSPDRVRELLASAGKWDQDELGLYGFGSLDEVVEVFSQTEKSGRLGGLGRLWVSMLMDASE